MKKAIKKVLGKFFRKRENATISDDSTSGMLASKGSCRMVWTSYGIAIAISHFVWPQNFS